jgi:hypothetical protein
LIGESLQRGFLSFLLAHERGLGLGVGFLLALLEELLEGQRLRGGGAGGRWWVWESARGVRDEA